MFANSICFSEDLIRKIANKVNNECKKGTIIVTFRKRLNSLNSYWENKRGFRRLISLGIASVFIYRRKNYFCFFVLKLYNKINIIIREQFM